MTVDAVTIAVRRLLDQAAELGPTVRYRSPEWLALPPSDVRRIAPVWLGAEAWHSWWTNEAVAERLRESFAIDAQVGAMRWRKASWDVSAALDWDALSRRPTFAELQKRRAS